MCMVSLYLLAILCCHTIDWDIFLRYWCLSQIYYYYYYKDLDEFWSSVRQLNLSVI